MSGGWKEWQEGYLEEITPLDPFAIGRLAWGEETFPEIPFILGKLNAGLATGMCSSSFLYWKKRASF